MASAGVYVRLFVGNGLCRSGICSRTGTSQVESRAAFVDEGLRVDGDRYQVFPVALGRVGIVKESCCAGGGERSARCSSKLSLESAGTVLVDAGRSHEVKRRARRAAQEQRLNERQRAWVEADSMLHNAGRSSEVWTMKV